MKIQEIIFQSIYEYPSLFYKSTWEESRRSVLHHLFIVLGNGMEFKNQKGKKVFKFKNRIPKSSDYREKILAGEKLYKIYSADENSSASTVWFPNLMEKEREIIFESELNNDQKAYPLLYSERKENETFEFIKEEFPENRGREKPYPFCFWYLPFVEINPHYSNYDYHTVDNMTVAELSESKKLIPADYSEGIVEIFKWALEFFESDERFFGDSYYNWKPDEAFKKKLEKAKEEGKLAEFQKKYWEAPEHCTEAQQIVDFVIARNRAKYISQCKKIIEAFS